VVQFAAMKFPLLLVIGALCCLVCMCMSQETELEDQSSAQKEAKKGCYKYKYYDFECDECCQKLGKLAFRKLFDRCGCESVEKQAKKEEKRLEKEEKREKRRQDFFYESAMSGFLS